MTKVTLTTIMRTEPVLFPSNLAEGI